MGAILFSELCAVCYPGDALAEKLFSRECGGILVWRQGGRVYSVPHYQTGFLIFGHLVDYLQNHVYKHTQYIKMITALYTESFDVNISRDNHMTQHDSKQQCVSLKL